MAAPTADSLRRLARRGDYGALLSAVRQGIALSVLREIDSAEWWRPWRMSAWQATQLRRAEQGLPRVQIPALPPSPPSGGRPPPPPAAPPPRSVPQPFVTFRRARAGETFETTNFGMVAQRRAPSNISQVMGRAPLRELGTTGARITQDLTGRRYLREIDLADDVAGRTMRARRMDQILQRAQAAAGQTRPAAQRAPSTATLTLASRFADSLSFSVHVPGNHYSGHPNDDVIDWLEASGRPFRADTPELRDHVRGVLVDVFSRGEWNPGQAARVAARAIRDWIVRRFERQGLDVDLAALNSVYRSWKSAHGYSSQIGIKTGFLLSRVRGAEVTVTQ